MNPIRESMFDLPQGDLISQLRDLYDRATTGPTPLELGNFVRKNITKTKVEAAERIANLLLTIPIKDLLDATSPKKITPKKTGASSVQPGQGGAQPVPLTAAQCKALRSHFQQLADIVWHSKLFKTLTPDQRDKILEARACLETNVFFKLGIRIQQALCRIRDNLMKTKGLSAACHRSILEDLDMYEIKIRNYISTVIQDPKATYAFIKTETHDVGEIIKKKIDDEAVLAKKEKRPSRVQELEHLKGSIQTILADIIRDLPPARVPPRPAPAPSGPRRGPRH
jgi:hypothetical protein